MLEKNQAARNPGLNRQPPIAQMPGCPAEYSPGPLKIALPNQLLTPGTSDHRRHTYMTVLTSLIELGILFVWL